MQATYVMLHPFAAHEHIFYHDRPRNTHTLYLQNRLKWRHVAMAYVCVLYNSTTYSKKEKNTKNSVILRQPTLFQQKKFILATAHLSPAESCSNGVFRRFLHHDVEFLLISTLVFYIHTLSTAKKIIISMAIDHITRVQLQNLDYFCHISTTEGAAAKGHMLLESTVAVNKTLTYRNSILRCNYVT